MQVLLMVVTLSLYSIYWYYATHRELHFANENESGNDLWILLMFIPLVNLFAVWHYCGQASAFTKDKYPTFLMFALWVFFRPAVWFLTQRELNQASEQSA